jgi:hypothetical protein
VTMLAVWLAVLWPCTAVPTTAIAERDTTEIVKRDTQSELLSYGFYDPRNGSGSWLTVSDTAGDL